MRSALHGLTEFVSVSACEAAVAPPRDLQQRLSPSEYQWRALATCMVNHVVHVREVAGRLEGAAGALARQPETNRMGTLQFEPSSFQSHALSFK